LPTRRLPIYQSVLSRWFSEEGVEHDPVDEPAPSAPSTSDTDNDLEESREGSLLDGYDHAEQSSTGEEEPIEPLGIASDWQSASDNGWQAAQALLESKDEEITPAGLPKRVPNSYLVPGSIGPSEQDVFADATVGKPSHRAIARSATAARSRMASFQRGYTSGRHAMKEQAPDRAGDGGGVSVSGGGMRSLSEDSSEERQ
jgi:hypothetical protein